VSAAAIDRDAASPARRSVAMAPPAAVSDFAAKFSDPARPIVIVARFDGVSETRANSMRWTAPAAAARGDRWLSCDRQQ
jgi:hypothetical protein